MSKRGDLVKALDDYARLIGPWAKSVAEYMVADVARRNAKAWKEQGDEMSRALRNEIANAPTGDYFRLMMAEQTELITSLPAKAAERVNQLATEYMIGGQRADGIMKEIMRTGEVTENRARMIARTEVSRAATLLTQARSEFAGSEGYIWRTVGDADVRHTHRKLEGKFIRWDSPPKTDEGLAPYHAGAGPNCRCFPEPVLPDL
jgi:SPP1 gp7 family putative phage head morphogenesis protein